MQKIKLTFIELKAMSAKSQTLSDGSSYVYCPEESSILCRKPGQTRVSDYAPYAFSPSPDEIVEFFIDGKFKTRDNGKEDVYRFETRDKAWVVLSSSELQEVIAWVNARKELLKQMADPEVDFHVVLNKPTKLAAFSEMKIPEETQLDGNLYVVRRKHYNYYPECGTNECLVCARNENEAKGVALAETLEKCSHESNADFEVVPVTAVKPGDVLAYSEYRMSIVDKQ